MIEIVPVTTSQELKVFVEFPFQLYQKSPFWVPPLIKDEIETLDAKKNPVFQNATAHYFIAKKDGKLAGRVAVIINHVEVEELHKKKVRFGWFDAIDDLGVTKALMDQVFKIGREHQLEYAEGPVGFSNMEKAGILTKGFDEMNTMITWYHYPYYAEHFEKLGFEKQATWVEYRIKDPQEIKDKVRKFSKLVKERYGLSVIRFKNKKEILPYVDAMFGLLNNTYNTLQTFVPIQQYQIDYYKKKYFGFLTPDYITCIQDQSGKLIAFSVVMPSFSKALKKANGKLMPLGWYHIIKAQRKNDTAAFYLIGIDPEYQGKGVTAIIFEEMQELFKAKGIREVETNPELIENKAVQQLWKDYNPVQHKERSTFRKIL
ncbi:MAG TPA: GNAT family N-acetyltransferase [Flavobacteriaceae bacterium]|nr:GNAT family N-acetyltransferase [Flavobacteriaceae bacterium]MCB9213437.1 GNAT family N-acetyltransferase [Alteromonas sp.]HPF12502.1 GNAT family N-acetyltransferase [Flavobacteriaceae bacterium]HQU22373.1 GNAT family N-acetyltransferase [Flavobacteriaceae bacterium]HQU66310.1 GNAT family N-acetyltransferase [Flavobacteriaceae bacterium]